MTTTKVLVTGAQGFVGRNLVEALRQRGGVDCYAYDLGMPEQGFLDALGEAEVIFHLAGVNRPPLMTPLTMTASIPAAA